MGAVHAMAIDALEIAPAMLGSELPRERAETIAEQTAKGFASNQAATKVFVRAEIALLRAELHNPGLLQTELGVLSWRMAGMLLPEARLVSTLTRLT
jgi:hypothetical protein